MNPEYLPFLGGVAIAVIGVGGIWLKGLYDARFARLDDRAKLTASTLAEIDSLRKNADAQDDQMRAMRAEIDRAQRDNLSAQRANLRAAQDNFSCEQRCAALTAKVEQLVQEVAALKILVERWRLHTGLEAPP